MDPPPRSPEQRKSDTLEKLRGDVDLWVASASEDGDPLLLPLSLFFCLKTPTAAARPPP